MTEGQTDGRATDTSDRYQVLLAISEAIISHRDLPSLFHDLAGHLGRVSHFDHLALVLHDGATNTMRLHILETAERVPAGTVIVLPVEEDPAGLVWQTQQPLVTSHINELIRWPQLLERLGLMCPLQTRPRPERESGGGRSPRSVAAHLSFLSFI